LTSSLTSKQRAFLRSQAHAMKPVVQVGNDGVTEPVLRSLAEAFNTRELLKVKVLEGAPVTSREAAELLRDGVEGAEVPQVIGRTIVLYRPFPDGAELALPR